MQKEPNIVSDNDKNKSHELNPSKLGVDNIKKITPNESLLKESMIYKLGIDSQRFHKFDKATSTVKDLGKIIGFSANTHKGKVRNYNEDRVSILLNAQKNFKKLAENGSNFKPNSCSIFSIFDGHGGNSCCNFLKDNLHKAILDELDIEGMLISSVKPIYKKLDSEYQNLTANIVHNLSGSCAITVIILDDSVIVFNVGDSRAIGLKKDGKSIQELTTDHKPDRLSEFTRIIENGGELYKVSTNSEGKHQFHFSKNNKDIKRILELEKTSQKMFFGPWRIKPGSLSVARSFGDFEAKDPKLGGLPNIITSEPEAFDFDANEFEFIVIACFFIRRRSLRCPK